MADGGYRFSGAGQYFYQGQNQQAHRGHLHQRTGSPTSSARLGFHNNDTPSPNRSTGTNSPAFSMFGQGHHGGQHSLLNGNQNHRGFQVPMNLNKYSQQSGQHQSNHHQNHGSDQIFQNGYNHQHNMSSGTLSSTTPHFTPSHLHSSTPVGGQSRVPDTEHWKEQVTVANATREMQQAHIYARSSGGQNKQSIPPALQAALRNDDEDKRALTSPYGKQPWRTLDFSGQGVRTISSSLFNYPFLERLFFNHNKLRFINPDIGQLRNLTFLDLSQNELTHLPPQMGMLVNLKGLYLFDNHLHTLPYEMGYLYNLEFLGIEGNPLNDEIRNTMAEGGTQELIRSLRESIPEMDPPDERDWIILDETPVNTAEEDRFTVFDANILCPKYVTATQYPYVPSRALAWDRRREMVMNEIRHRDADIVCLQEIDSESFNEAFRPTLARNDYKGIFWQKSRAQTMAEREAKLVDGCATFWKNSKYIMLDKQMVDFRKMAINRADMKGEHDIFNRVMTRDDIATVTFLENRLTGSRVIVVNTHVFWNPEFADVKVVQIAILMEQVARLAETYAKWKPCTDKEVFKFANGDSDEPEVEVKEPAPSQTYAHSTDIPMLMCGDFNSTPGSGPYDLIAHGSLSNSHEDLAGRSYGTFTRDGMRHPFSMKSAYSNVGEMEFTNYTAQWQGVVDYIWYSTNALQNTGLLGEIDREYLKRVPGFPSWHFPSDHLPLFAEFVVKGKKEKKVVEADFGPSTKR
ncbi:glucose-repressible alcohol dehydrogenase-like protein transcriptional effector [Elsinoe ampelina]|uniref:CCR4-Not complex 3'-5'-exoribonuclease subunit Ccr4 n=1 Tax=Elsinoe ampelina TaxID=302913 RepID=A0A6A6G2W2_9PEZI|nr:glucose-repressible alcohol dehydrogenase-like protein transcriptional effector [Elsinoe ampelina]